MYKTKHKLAPSTVSELLNYIICFSVIAETFLERDEKLIFLVDKVQGFGRKCKYYA